MKFVGKIELCEMPNEEVAGRAKIKMSALKISKDDNDNNENGLNWVKSYVQDNINSIIGASYKVAFIDDNKTYPSGHGCMVYDDSGNITFPDSETVGSIQDAYIENMNIDGEDCEVLSTEGFIYKQSYPNFYDWLKTETSNGIVYGSIEINGKGENKQIIYDGNSINSDGTPLNGRKPKSFDFTALAILSDFVPPADKFSRVFEVNSKQKEDDEIMAKEKINIDNSKDSAYNSSSWNVDKGAYFNKCKEASNAMAVFNEGYLIKNISSVNDVVEADVKYPHHHFEGNKMVVDISGIKAAVQRLAQNDSSNQEAKQHAIKHYKELGLELPEFLGGDNKNNKQEVNSMDEKVVLEFNQKIEDKTNEINELNTKNTELNAKNAELSEAVTNANKTCEELNAKITSLTEELNACKKELEEKKKAEMDAEAEAKKVECNSYFETEIPKDGFSEAEVNSLKHFVEEVNLDGLKSAEAEICAKKFKEIKKAEIAAKEIEVNSIDNGDKLFFSTKVESVEVNDAETGAELFK